jgi:hypothetical protein
VKYKENIIYNYLGYYGDAQPHKFIDQCNLFALTYKKDVLKMRINLVELTRYCVQNNWLTGVGKNFYSVSFPFRMFKLTNKGDLMYREMAIWRSGNFSYFKYFDREGDKEWNPSKK